MKKEGNPDEKKGPKKSCHDTTTSVQVVEAVVHLHEGVVEDSQVSLNILHTLSMLVHELV